MKASKVRIYIKFILSDILLKPTLIGIFLFYILYALLVPASAHAAAITIGTAANYGLVVGAGQTLDINGGVGVTGNIGIGANSNFALSGINLVSGAIYQDSGVTTTNGSITLVSGGTITQSMSGVISGALSASNAAAALTPTAGLVGQGTALSISGSSVTIKALSNLSENVLTISSLSLLNGMLTFDDNGYTGAKFIVNVVGGFSVGSIGTGKSVIQGINGASASDILFNIEGTGSTVSVTGNSSNALIGTILAPSRNITIGGGGTLSGDLIAGVNNLGKSYTVSTGSGGFNISQMAYQPSTMIKTPEPSTLALFGTSVAFCGLLRRKRRHL